MREIKSLRNRALIFSLGIVLSLLGLWYVLQDVDFEKLWATSSRIQWLPLLGALAAHWLGLVVARAFLVRFLVSHLGSIPVRRAYRYVSIGLFINVFMPLRAGEVARIVGIAKAADAPIASVAGALALERTFDLTMLAAIGLALTQLAPLPEQAKVWILAAAIGFAVVLIVLAYIARMSLKEKDAAKDGKLKSFVWNLFVKFSSGFEILRSWRGVLTTLFWILVLWGFTGLLIWLRLEAFEISAGFGMVLLLIFSINLGVAMPSAPAYVGVYHAAAVFAMATVMGIDQEIAVGFAFFSWLVDIVPSSIIGVGSMILEGLSFKKTVLLTRSKKS